MPPPLSVAAMERTGAFLDLLGTRPEQAVFLDETIGKGTAATLAESLRVGLEWAQMRQELKPLFRNDAWKAQVPQLCTDLEDGSAKGFKSYFVRIGPRYRRARKSLARLVVGELPKDAGERLQLAQRLAADQERQRALEQEEPFLRQHIPSWRGEQTDFSGLHRAAEWIAQVEGTGVPVSAEGIRRTVAAVDNPPKLADAFRQRSRAVLETTQAVVELLQLDLEQVGLSGTAQDGRLIALRERFRILADGVDRYDEWCRIEDLVRRLSEEGLNALVGMLDDGRLDPADAVVEFNYACAEARLDMATSGVARVRGTDRHELVKTFASLDTTHIEDVRDLIRSCHLAQLPTGAAGEMGIIRGEIGRKRRHMPIRRLMERAGGMVQRIKPVFLMSPISVAQFLPPRSLRFDLLVVDEASQVKPEDAIGAIARCGQIVIVGDQKQLPPTSFFDRLGAGETAEEDDEEIAASTEMESVLTLCEARGLNPRLLEWHYRSRDPSLIRVSNEEFYRNELILLPSPLEQDGSYGLSFERVPGVYASRGSGSGERPGTNRIEAEHVVRAVCAHAKDAPNVSLGVVTFSKAQADMVTELLEYERRSNEVLNDFLREGHAEDAFVKNIENVQGDERDVILVSVGYGPTQPGGRLRSMRFGPINADGGERRLNVLFTRARARCRVFASFEPGEMDLDRARGTGPRILKRFLEYAATGQSVEHVAGDRGADSPFEEDVAKVIRSLGYLADHQVGSAGFRIDIGVRHPDAPGRYILAVECDGATYHSALSARERDRHRQEVLEGMLWTFHRIWSTDWFHRRAEEIQRLQEALGEARDNAARRTVVGANESERSPGEGKALEIPIQKQAYTHPGLRGIPYRKARANEIGLSLRVGVLRPEPHEVPVRQLASVVRKVVDVEGPVHLELVARRVADAFGKGRTGTRILEATRKALQFARRDAPGDLLEKDGFWLTSAQSASVPVRNRSEVDGVNKPAHLPPMEIVAAADWIERESGRVDTKELVREVARLLGFKRTGAELQKVIRDACSARPAPFEPTRPALRLCCHLCPVGTLG